MLRRAPLRLRQAGLSLVEMLVGITVGLFIVGAATLVVTTQLGDNRRLLLETQLQQDLRASADIIAREIRRAGAWDVASLGVWYPGRTAAVASNPFSGFDVDGEAGSIDFEYQRGPGAEGPYGFRISETGVIQSQLGASGWQDLTDGRVMSVSGFALELDETASDPLPCPRLCDDASTDCWPRLVTRGVRIVITATSRSDAAISRTVSSYVRPRNDQIQFNNGANICP